MKIYGIVVLCLSFQQLYPQQEIKLDNREDYIVQVQKEFEGNKWEDGKIVLDKALLKYPDDSDLHTLTGKYYHYKGNQDKARYHLLKAINIFNNNVDAKHIMVNVETKAERYSSAICYVNELLEINPYWRGLWRKKIELYKLQGNEIEADRLQKRIYHIFPEDPQIRTDYLYSLEIDGLEKYKSGNFEEAIEFQKALLREKPDSADSYIYLTNSFLKNNERHLALAYTEQGLAKFPNHPELQNKKAGILAENEQYDQLLPFLEQNNLHSQYGYYLQRAAQQAKSRQPYFYYGKIFDRNPGDSEAFNIMFSHLIVQQDYDEALLVLEKHRRIRGNSKELYLKEKRVFHLMQNKSRHDGLTKQLMALYPNDPDIQEAYVLVILEEAKNNMAEMQYAQAIPLWYEVIEYGDPELKKTAKNSLINAYQQIGASPSALDIVDEMVTDDPKNNELILKKSQIYLQQKKYQNALLAYEQVLDGESSEKRNWYLIGYGEMMSGIIKESMENYKYDDAFMYADRWLEHDPKNNLALRHAVNLSFKLKKENVLSYALRGREAHPDDMFFVVKFAELQKNDDAQLEKVSDMLNEEIKKNPYHPDLINVNSEIAESYSLSLIKQDKNQEALDRLNEALAYSPDNKSLKYAKGIAFEKLKQYDSAYYYQSFYEPDLREAKKFYSYLDYLEFKQKKNEFGIYHLRSRFGDNPAITTISSAEYSRFSNNDIFTGRVHYAGRETGKGFQVQAAWSRTWDKKTATSIDLAWANQFFSKLAANASVYRYFESLHNTELELGLGYRELDTTFSTANLNDNKMYNLVVGATKEWETFRLNFRFNNFLLDNSWFYNAHLNARHYVFSPKSYITAMAGAGTSPEVDLINYQLYDRFSDLNTMVGAGFSHLIYKTITVGVLGTWYNFPTEPEQYRNLYNLYLNVNVAF